MATPSSSDAGRPSADDALPAWARAPHTESHATEDDEIDLGKWEDLNDDAPGERSRGKISRGDRNAVNGGYTELIAFNIKRAQGASRRIR